MALNKGTTWQKVIVYVLRVSFLHFLFYDAIGPHPQLPGMRNNDSLSFPHGSKAAQWFHSFVIWQIETGLCRGQYIPYMFLPIVWSLLSECARIFLEDEDDDDECWLDSYWCIGTNGCSCDLVSPKSWLALGRMVTTETRNHGKLFEKDHRCCHSSATSL